MKLQPSITSACRPHLLSPQTKMTIVPKMATREQGCYQMVISIFEMNSAHQYHQNEVLHDYVDPFNVCENYKSVLCHIKSDIFCYILFHKRHSINCTAIKQCLKNL